MAQNEFPKNMGEMREKDQEFYKAMTELTKGLKEKNMLPKKSVRPSFIACVIVVFGFLLGFIPLTIYSAWTVGFIGSKFWAWFVVPFGLPSIGIWQASGIALMFRLFTYEMPMGDTSGKLSAGHKTIIYMVIPWLSFLTGYCIHRLM